MPLGIFRNRNVTGANLVQVLMVAGMFGIFFLGALYLQRVLGFDPVQVGVAFLPVSVGIGVLSLKFSPILVTRFGPRAVLVPGLVSILVGLVLFTQVPVDGNYWTDVLPDDAAARHRRRPVVPRDDDARDVGCRRQRRRAGLRAS